MLAAAFGAVLFGCQRDRFGHDDPNAVESTLTVNEARDFFEYQFSETMPYLTKLPQDRPTGMMPGDFTPLWDKARIGANREMDGADVPIDPKFIFVAVFNQVTPQGDTVRRTVDVIQKLVVKKWRNTEEYEAFCYIASIVPTPEYYAKHKNVGREFRYGGDKGEFSGFVIYRTLAGKLVGIDNYERGRRTRHDYFPRITGENEDSIYSVARLSVPEMEVQAGTAAAFAMDMEEDDPCRTYVTDPVECVGEAVCTVCHKKPCECSAGKREDPDPKLDPVPDPKDDTDKTGGGGGGNEDNNDINTGNTPSVSTLFAAKGVNESLAAEINEILRNLSKIGISNKVLSQLMAQGKINLEVGQVPGHPDSYAVYALQTNVLTLNTALIQGSFDPETNMRNSIMEETFHAFQYVVYGNLFNQRCYEFEAKVYGTIIINMYAGNHGIVFDYLNPMAGDEFASKFALDVKRMTGNFTHGISNEDMNTLYHTYGDYCTQYPEGNPKWEFKAIQQAQNN